MLIPDVSAILLTSEDLIALSNRKQDSTGGMANRFWRFLTSMSRRKWLLNLLSTAWRGSAIAVYLQVCRQLFLLCLCVGNMIVG